MSGPRRWMALVIAVASSVTLLSATAPAAAQRSTAAELEREARQAYSRGEYAAAAHGFEASYSAEPQAATKFNAALSWEMAGDPAHAADAYEAVLKAPGVDAASARQSRARLEKLRPTLARLAVTGPDGADVRVDGDEPRPVPVNAYVTPGDHLVTWRESNGETGQRRVSAALGQTASITLPAPAPPAAPQQPEAQHTVVASAPPAVEPKEAPPPPSHAARTWGWISLGVALAAAGSAVALGEATISNRDGLVASGDHDQGDYDRAILFRALTNVAWGTAAVTGLVGGALLLWPRSDARSPHVAWTIGPSCSAVSLAGGF